MSVLAHLVYHSLISLWDTPVTPKSSTTSGIWATEPLSTHLFFMRKVAAAKATCLVIVQLF